VFAGGELEKIKYIRTAFIQCSLAESIGESKSGVTWFKKQPLSKNTGNGKSSKQVNSAAALYLRIK